MPVHRRAVDLFQCQANQYHIRSIVRMYSDLGSLHGQLFGIYSNLTPVSDREKLVEEIEKIRETITPDSPSEIRNTYARYLRLIELRSGEDGWTWKLSPPEPERPGRDPRASDCPRRLPGRRSAPRPGDPAPRAPAPAPGTRKAPPPRRLSAPAPPRPAPGRRRPPRRSARRCRGWLPRRPRGPPESRRPRRQRSSGRRPASPPRSPCEGQRCVEDARSRASLRAAGFAGSRSARRRRPAGGHGPTPA